jgi:single-strand DNA-binding protein
MANDLNRCEFIGRVGKIEKREMPNGNAVVNLSLATNETWKDKNTGEKQEKCNWTNVVIFGALADIADKYVEVGNQIFIAGKLQTRKFTNKDGNDQYSTEVVVDGFQGVLQMLGGKSEGAAPQQNKPTQQKPAQQKETGFNDNFDDDIPF